MGVCGSRSPRTGSVAAGFLRVQGGGEPDPAPRSDVPPTIHVCGLRMTPLVRSLICALQAPFPAFLGFASKRPRSPVAASGLAQDDQPRPPHVLLAADRRLRPVGPGTPGSPLALRPPDSEAYDETPLFHYAGAARPMRNLTHLRLTGYLSRPFVRAESVRSARGWSPWREP